MKFKIKFSGDKYHFFLLVVDKQYIKENSMKLLHYKKGSGYRLGCLTGDYIFDLKKSWKYYAESEKKGVNGKRIPTDIIELFKGGKELLKEV